MMIPFNKIIRKHHVNITGVLHCGAHEGQEANDYHKLGVEKMIFVEADPDTYERLKSNISLYPNAIALNACLSDVDGQDVEFYRTNNDGQSSSFLKLKTHKIAHPEVHVVGTISLKTKRLDSLLEEMNINVHEFNFINLDLQCAELLALKGLGDYLRYFRYAYMEVNKEELYENCPHVNEIDLYMNGFGFKRVETHWAGNTGWGDAFYLKK